MPWLNRELNAILDSPAHLAHVIEHIMELITRIHILSPEFHAHLEPYLSPWTGHFIHEFYCYARSPYDMVGYDFHVQYQAGRPSSPAAQVMPSDSGGDSGDESNIRVLTSPPRARTPILVERLSSPEPGPSGGGGSVVDSGAPAALGRVRAFLATARAAEESRSESEDSDSPVEIVEVLPPRHERPPVIVTLSSDEEPPPPPPMPPPTDAERRRAAHRERRAAALAEVDRERRGGAEKRARSGDWSGKRRRRDGDVDPMGDVGSDATRKRKHRSTRTDRESGRKERRSERLRSAELRNPAGAARSQGRRVRVM